MPETVLIFPNQLFEVHPLLQKPMQVLLIEDSLFFGDEHYPLQFHKQKLLFHRASMRCYAQLLKQEGHQLKYVDYSEGKTLRTILEEVAQKNLTIQTLEPDDFILKKRMMRCCADLGLKLEFSPNPGFINTQEDNDAFFNPKKRWLMASFYKQQRKRFGIMLTEKGEPYGGKWSYDSENRKKLPKARLASLPKIAEAQTDGYLTEAKAYVTKHFPNNPGSLDSFVYPYTHQGAKVWLERFLKERLADFGPYEDAIVEKQSWLFHSVLSPLLNSGLLEPAFITKETLRYAENHPVPQASLEGFIRQIIGWREFMRAAYVSYGVQLRTSNHWQHKNSMPPAFYTAQTGILPIDDAIERILKTAYCHHIERLMVLGGFMFLCEIHPTAIYKWFMELFIDSYDWVMVSNVYAMSQDSAGGLITTKPYFSGSNYIRKMSHYKADDWCDVWDGLYWRFILKHQAKLARNPRWAMMVRQAHRLESAKKELLFAAAEGFLEKHFVK